MCYLNPLFQANPWTTLFSAHNLSIPCLICRLLNHDPSAACIPVLDSPTPALYSESVLHTSYLTNVPTSAAESDNP